jgi:hypothetical protein
MAYYSKAASPDNPGAPGVKQVLGSSTIPTRLSLLVSTTSLVLGATPTNVGKARP